MKRRRDHKATFLLYHPSSDAKPGLINKCNIHQSFAGKPALISHLLCSAGIFHGDEPATTGAQRRPYREGGRAGTRLGCGGVITGTVVSDHSLAATKILSTPEATCLIQTSISRNQKPAPASDYSCKSVSWPP